MSLFARSNHRNLFRQPLQGLLSVTGIALGVAVVLAVDLANHSALRAFELSERAVSGAATHTIVSATGGIDEDFYRALRIEHGFRDSAPRVTGSVRTPDGRTLQVLGVDPLAAQGMAVGGGTAERQTDAATLIGTPDGVMITSATAGRLGVSRGDALPVVADGKRRHLEIVSLLTGGDAVAEGLRNTLVMDISTAQVLLDGTGSLSRIDLILGDRGRRRLESVLPASLELNRSEARGRAMEQMTRAFQINLTALSLLALLIGAFLIYNTQTLYVLNRRETLAIWRTLGVTRLRIMKQVMTEAAWLALAGCVAGCLAGLALSRVLLALVTRTINDLYFALEVSSITVEPGAVARACALGITAALAASALPALEASRVQPRLALSRSRVEAAARRIRVVGPVLGAAMGLVAAVILAASDRSITAGFAGLFFIIAGFAVLVPAGLHLIAHGVAPLLQRLFGWMGLWSARNVLASMSRTQIAVTALTIALAATIGVSVMIQSFRLTVVHWLDNYLRADIYISRPDDSGSGIDPGLLRRLREHPGVSAVNTGLWRRLPTEGEPTTLFVLDAGARGFANFQLVSRESEEVWPAFSGRDTVIVSESYAYHHRLEPGDTIELPTERGRHGFTVADVFYDYGSDRGRVAIHRDIHDRHWDDPEFESLAVYLEPDTDGTAVLEAIERDELRGTGLRARSNERIRALSLAVFDRTFTVTEVLRLLTIVVAGIGILSALVAIQMDRAREFAVLRASGLTRGGLSRLMMLEGGIMGTASAVMAIPLGVLMAAVLVYIINKRSFGWSMQFTLPWEQLLATLVLGLLAGAAAALYPACRMNRRPLIGDLRHE
ncbi:MAG: FtsX-like permease family protein [Gammaproteobacteria bacterium]|nr:FtsX-like permease family protein [Gammaproteobacteria bacterium]